MTHVQIEDAFFDHPKVLSVGKDAKILAVAAICYCGNMLTDGFIPYGAVAVLGARTGVTKTKPAVDELLFARLWESVDGGYLAHDYLDYNTSAEKVVAKRAAARERMGRGRSPNVRANNERTSREQIENFARSSDEVRNPTTTTTTSFNSEELKEAPPKPPKIQPDPKPPKEPTYPADFNAFWSGYPTGRGGRPETFQRWKVLSDDDKAAAMAALPMFWAGRDWQEGFHKAPDLWLKGRLWENPPQPARAMSQTSQNGKPSALEFAEKARELERQGL